MEQTFAFFPLLPFVIRFAASIFAQLAPFLSFNTCCVICAALINFGLFIGKLIAAWKQNSRSRPFAVIFPAIAP